MGLKSTPYNSIQGALRAKRVIMGDPSNPNNAFQWCSITENLPGSANYDVSMPLLTKLGNDGLTVSEITQYVDDLRLIAATQDLAWQSGSQVAKGLYWLGLQDATRKRRMGSMRPGAWTGSIVTTDGDVVRKSFTKERWKAVQSKV